ncbi:MAG: hypothetical protein A3K19_33955 [Lentisphaerae bacterium RIFOXYB12_FULL_65_16]|nr:MAG: hypothetical protein A3K19_09830 [Lentisphaerae bacterium RIFOXYB12_FULL_65_16]OGV95327.1 MAG: hypothetical protein A3K19_33955 [Lentisphaerae bacterium RIFOXYB12_FULL_65_16]
MAYFFLDTGLLLGYVRGAPYAAYADKTYLPNELPNIATTSVVAAAEMHSIALRRGWEEKKLGKLREILGIFPTVDIGHPDVGAKFAEIDAYRQGKHPDRPLPKGLSARAMGDNDIWIAATAAVLNATLLTTDKDFDFLDGVFLRVVYVDPASTP